MTEKYDRYEGLAPSKTKICKNSYECSHSQNSQRNGESRANILEGENLKLCLILRKNANKTSVSGG